TQSQNTHDRENPRPNHQGRAGHRKNMSMADSKSSAEALSGERQADRTAQQRNLAPEPRRVEASPRRRGKLIVWILLILLVGGIAWAIQNHREAAEKQAQAARQPPPPVPV